MLSRFPPRSVCAAPTNWFRRGPNKGSIAWLARGRGVGGARGLTADHIAFWEHLLAAATATEAWNAELARHHWTGAYLAGARLRECLQRERNEMSALLKELTLLK